MKTNRTNLGQNSGQITPSQLEARQKNVVKAIEGRKAAIAARKAEAAAQVSDAGVPPIGVSEARLMDAKATLAELDVSQRRGELVSVAEAEAHWADVVTTIKTKILGVPSRVAQRMPHVAAEVVPVIESLLREALEEIAAVDGNTMDE